jgi:hypothetical protein
MPNVIDKKAEPFTFTDEDGNETSVTVDYTVSREADDTFEVRLTEVYDEDGDEIEQDNFMVEALRLQILESLDPAEFDEYEGNFDPDHARDEQAEAAREALKEDDDDE